MIHLDTNYLIGLLTLFETLKDFDGMAGDLPSDLADNLDHYVHGHPLV